MEKIILSINTANAIVHLMKEFSEDKTAAVEWHVLTVLLSNQSWSTVLQSRMIDEDLTPLDGISIDTVIRALYVGYEIDESYDYSVQQEIERCKRFIEDNRYPMDERAHYQKRLEGIEFTLKGLIK